MASGIVITDALPSHRDIQIFTSLIRDTDPVSKLLSSTSSQNFTVLAPSNSAMTSMSHKPWEDPAEYKELGTNAYEGQQGEDRAHRNVRKFVEAHLVPRAPWSENDKAQTLAVGEGDSPSGKAVWWEDSGDGQRVIAPDGVKVTSVASQASNGEIWILDSILKP